MSARAAIGWLLRVGLGGLLIVAGALKMVDPERFALEIANYQLWPDIAPLVSAVLPAIEIVTGAALIVLPSNWRRAAGLLALLLMTTFQVAVSSAYFRGVNIECGCFGGEGSVIDHITLARNFALMGVAVAIVVLERAGRAVARS